MKCIGITSDVFKIVAKLSSKQTLTRTSAKRSMFIMGTSLSWFTIGIFIAVYVYHRDLHCSLCLPQGSSLLFMFLEQELNSDLKKISTWGDQWKMSINSDVSKQAQEIIFSLKTSKCFSKIESLACMRLNFC